MLNNIKLDHLLLIRSCQYLTLALLVYIGITAFTIVSNSAIEKDSGGIKVNTDIKAMSPKFASQAGVQKAIDTLSKDIEKRFTLVLHSDDIDEVENAAETLFDTLPTHQEHETKYPFTLIDPLDSAERYTSLLSEYRYYLLTESQYQNLSTSDDKQLLSSAKARLHSLDSAGQIFPITQDPFGLLSNYMLANEMLTNEAGIGGNSLDEVITIENNGEAHFYYPLFFYINDNALSLETQTLIQQQLTELKQNLKKEYSSLSFLHSGILFFATDAAATSKKDISAISMGSSIGIFLLLLLSFRSITALLLPGLSIAFGISLAFFTSHLLFGSVHIITIIFGAGLIGVVIDYSLHAFFHSNKSTDNNKPHNALYKALALSLLTSVIGYSALAFSELPSLQRIAIFCAIGLIGAWILVIAATPLYKYTTYARRDQFLAFILTAINTPLKRLQGFYLPLAVIVIVSFFALMFIGINTSDNPRIFFSPNKQLLNEETQVNNLVSGYEPGTYIVVRGKTVNDIYQNIEELQETHASFTQTFGIQSFMPSPHDQARNYQQQARLFNTKGLASQFLAQQGATEAAIQTLENHYQETANTPLLPQTLFRDLGNSVVNLWVQGEQFAYSFILIPKKFDVSKFEAVAEKNADIFLINTANMVSQTIEEQRSSASWQLALALLLITCIIYLRYRSIKKLTLMLIPLSAIAITTLALQSLAIPITLFHVMAMFLVLGLGMDYVIFVSEIEHDSEPTLYAVILSAMTSLLSFGLLSTSTLPIVNAFGLTVLIGNSVNLIGAIMLANYLSPAHNTTNLTTSIKGD